MDFLGEVIRYAGMRNKTAANPEDVRQMTEDITQIFNKYSHLTLVGLTKTLEESLIEAFRNCKIQ